MTRAVVISAAVREAIRVAIDEARKTPMPLDQVMSQAMPDKPSIALADRKMSPNRPLPQTVEIPVGVRCNLTFEEQPSGLCRHLSISVDAEGKMPNIPVVAMIAQEFGLKHGVFSPFCKTWSEEYEPGRWAINFVWRDE